ncbi:ZIP family metal transporter [Anaerovorax odorimutans]|uniref:ZIP family metal transporter n=1 Tax=Anaerovorax odorimutans TaxID=109327 RepID=A0ABT1RSE8_9FIRM|nr:ZIP family metal transporter [Anaerovorax odorimutans]MCQ4638108.1 ZIP family metal transporter [Anaerovorax odorimutans]
MYGIIAGLFVILASIVGSLAGLIFKKITHRTNDMILGFASGVMLTAAFLGLLPTAFETFRPLPLLVGVAGVFAGAILISAIDRFVPHIHFDNGHFKESETKGHGSRVLLLIIAIAIHNIPEGLATGIVFSEGLTDSAVMVAVSMIIQKIPEGLIVAVPLLGMGMKRSKALKISLLIAFMMLPGIVVGVLLGTLPTLLSSFFYAFTFGAIVYVVSDEIIPESHEHGYQRAATFSLIAGVIIVVLLQNI